MDIAAGGVITVSQAGLIFPDGAAATPSFVFASDTDTGVFGGTTLIGFSMGGSEIGRMSSGILLWGTTETTSASSGDVVLDYQGAVRSVVQGGGDTAHVIGKGTQGGNIVSVGDGTAPVSLWSTKSDTGHPAAVEGLIYINTFDNGIFMYADGAWRTLVSW